MLFLIDQVLDQLEVSYKDRKMTTRTKKVATSLPTSECISMQREIEICRVGLLIEILISGSGRLTPLT